MKPKSRAAMDDLIAFLRARLDEDAVVLEEGRTMFRDAAREIVREGGELGTWRARPSDEYANIDLSFARFHDEIEAKRAIIAEYAKTEAQMKAAMDEYEALLATSPKTDRDRSDMVIYRERSWRLRGRLEGLEVVLRHVASAYADHPDYREEWRP